MAVPKRKTTPSRRGKRRSHDSQFGTNAVECPNCGELKLAHHVCLSCGYYNKKEIIDKSESITDEDSDIENQN
tara:strand:- start:298 stop:516 length:219 start_codon:yes stop_codon:yes gene_type:complete